MTTKQNDSPFAVEFWQTVADTAYMMDHESRANQARWLCGLDQALTEMLAEHPEISVHGSLDNFAMHAVQSLVRALARVDGNYQQAFKEAFKRATGAVDLPKPVDAPENGNGGARYQISRQTDLPAPDVPRDPQQRKAARLMRWARQGFRWLSGMFERAGR